MTVLVDTNVILDYVLKREPHANAAFKCMDCLMTISLSIRRNGVKLIVEK